MKRDAKALDLRSAFPEEPEACHAALMNAARSVREEKTMKNASIRVALLAALIILCTMAVAAAAGSLLGWSDLFGRYGARVPETAQRVMSEDWNRHEYTLGPVRFTTQELLCDGHIAMASTAAAMADGSDALICAEPFDAIGAAGENGEQMARRLGVPPETTWLEAARLLGRRLFAVRAILEVPAELDSGSAMEDILWNEDGSAVCFSMSELLAGASGEALEMQLYLSVTEYDAETEKDALTARVPLSVYLEAPLEEHVYPLDFTADGYALREVRAELTDAGLYLYSTFTAPEGATEDDVYARALPCWLDAQGEPLPEGISLSAALDASRLPEGVCTQMIAVDAIPETLIMQLDDGTTLTLTR